MDWAMVDAGFLEGEFCDIVCFARVKSFEAMPTFD